MKFTGNSARMGSGGAVYVAQGCSYLSFGGMLPLIGSCLGCGANVLTGSNNFAQYNTIVKGYGQAYGLSSVGSSYKVLGYYLTFVANAASMLTYCQDHAFVGNYRYGFNPSCILYSPTSPGVNGMSPYYQSGSSIVINVTRYNAVANPTISFTLFPNVVGTDGSNAGVSFVGNSAGTNPYFRNPPLIPYSTPCNRYLPLLSLLNQPLLFPLSLICPLSLILPFV